MKKVKNILPSILYLLIFILVLTLSILLILNTKSVKSTQIFKKVIGERIVKVYELKKGINFIGTDFNSKDRAIRIIKNNPDISVIGDFDNNRWDKTVVRSTQKSIIGKNFRLKQNKGYLIIAKENFNLELRGRKFLSDNNLRLDKGLNLIGLSEYYQSSELINEFKKNNINLSGVSLWINEISNYTSYVVDENVIYGEDFEIEDTKGVFITVE